MFDYANNVLVLPFVSYAIFIHQYAQNEKTSKTLYIKNYIFKNAFQWLKSIVYTVKQFPFSIKIIYICILLFFKDMLFHFLKAPTPDLLISRIHQLHIYKNNAAIIKLNEKNSN